MRTAWTKGDFWGKLTLGPGPEDRAVLNDPGQRVLVFHWGPILIVDLLNPVSGFLLLGIVALLTQQCLWSHGTGNHSKAGAAILNFLGKFLNVHVPQFPCLCSIDNNTVYSIGLIIVNTIGLLNIFFLENTSNTSRLPCLPSSAILSLLTLLSYLELLT